MSKIKLVPCPNITKRELMTALMDGRKFTTEYRVDFKTHDKDTIHWDNSFGNSPVREGLSGWAWRGFKYLHEIVEQQWYEDPDMVGKPVKARNDEDGFWIITKFIGHYPGIIHGFKCDFNNYIYAEPVTAADLYKEQV